MDLIKELAELALATRLKRLSERLGNDVSRIYKEHNVGIESKWFLILQVLQREKSLSIVEISEQLKLSHPAIVQFADQLLEKGLVNVSADKDDGRKRILSLSDKGKAQMKNLEPLLSAIKLENAEWLKEAEANLMDVLTQLEHALDEKSMYERIRRNLADSGSK